MLTGVEGLGLTYFGNKDVVRHPLVQRIVEAYDSIEDSSHALDQGQGETARGYPVRQCRTRARRG